MKKPGRAAQSEGGKGAWEEGGKEGGKERRMSPGEETPRIPAEAAGWKDQGRAEREGAAGLGLG